MNRHTKNRPPYFIYILACLVLAHTPLYAGGSRNFTPADFAQGTAEDLEITSSSMTLVKKWTFGGQAPLALAARWRLGFAFDELRGQALVFGGMDPGDAALGDTWLWSQASGWEQRAPAGPPAPRYGHGLVWIGDKFLLFGGSSGNDTWTYEILPAPGTWANIPTSPTPPGRLSPAMAYDPDLGKVVMFGGGDDSQTWIYNIAGSSWSPLNLSPAPSPRAGASMAYDRIQKKMVLFGGKLASDGTTLLNDTWTFDVATSSWTEKVPSSSPEARWQGAMTYDTVNGSIIHYGGFTTSYTGDLWYYNFTGNKWSKHYEYDAGEPAGRYGHGFVYDTLNKTAVLFGGKYTEVAKSLWTYAFLPAGAWTSDPLDLWAGHSSTTPSTWDGISAEFGDKPAGTGVLFQLASSTDDINYDPFSGPGGDTGAFYPAGAPVAVWTGHNNRRFIKIKAGFFSNDPPARPKASLFTLSYNRAPYAPALVSPENGGLTNDPTPLFKCGIISDADADPALLYQFQADNDPDFSSPEISEENIPAGGSDVSFSTGTALTEGVWYWRARAKDPAGLYGYWSDAFSFTLDTHTPPGPVSAMTAARGAAVNSVLLTWTFPGDDKGRVDNGTCTVRFSPAEIPDEPAWAAAAATERSALFSAAPGGTVQTTVTGLAYAATYYFAIKTKDELGNISPLSSANPFAMTDSSPTITLISPNAGGLMVGTTVIAWTQADANSGDSITKRIFISSDSGAGYSILIASGITSGATFYSWHSAGVPNGAAYRIKVEATDQRGLSAFDSSDADFATDNENEAPAVYFISVPAAGQEIYLGSMTVTWGVADVNSMDTHTYNLLLSVNSGATFAMFASGLTQSSYTFNTAAFANLSTYRLKLTVADSGTPQLTGMVLSPVFTVVNSLPPKTFALIRPLEDSFPAILDLNFSWEPAADPEGGAVTYTLQYSTTAGPDGGNVVTGLAAANYTPPLNSLLTGVEYFWKVTAQDQYAKKTYSPSGSFMLSRTKAKSPDGLLLVETLSGMPEEGYLNFQNARTSRAGLIELADRNSKGNRFIKLLSYPIWDVQARDLGGNVLPGAAIAARLTVTLPEAAGASGLDAALADLGHLKISRLDEAMSSWAIPSPQLVDPAQKRVSAAVSGLSTFGVAAAVIPTQILSGVTNFPNPFAAGRETTRIRYTLTLDSSVRIRIYTLLGDLVRVLECDAGAAGCGKGDASGPANELLWDGRNGAGRTVANGVYLAEIRAESAAGRQKEIRRLGVLK